MLTARSVSLALLFLEASLLAFPSIWGVIFFIGSFFSLIAELTNTPLIFILSLLLAFLSFISFWHILFDVATEEFKPGKKINSTYLLFASLGVLLSITTQILFKLSITSGFEIFLFGILYVPTYFHLLYEIKRKNGTILLGNH